MQIRPASEIKAVCNVPLKELQKQQKELERSRQPKRDLSKGLSLEEIRKGTEQIETIISAFNRRLKFNVHDETNRIYVQVIDRATAEVIKEIPPSEILDMLAKIYELVGILVDERV